MSVFRNQKLGRGRCSAMPHDDIAAPGVASSAVRHERDHCQMRGERESQKFWKLLPLNGL